MVAERNKGIVRLALEEVFNGGRLEAIDRLYAPEFVNHAAPSMGREIRGVEGVKANIALWRTAFPDLRFTLDAEVAEGDLVASRWTARGTHLGPLRDIPATGRRVTVSALEMSRLADGKIAEQWLLWDTLDLMNQLGASSGGRR